MRKSTVSTRKLQSACVKVKSARVSYSQHAQTTFTEGSWPELLTIQCYQCEIINPRLPTVACLDRSLKRDVYGTAWCDDMYCVNRTLSIAI